MSFQQTRPTTRSEFNARLLSLSTRNAELEKRLREAEQAAMFYEIKTVSQHAMIQDLKDAIHSMANTSPDTCESSSDAKTSIPEDLCLMITKNAQRVADLSEEVQRMRTEMFQQMEESTGDLEFEDISLHDDDSDIRLSSLASSSPSSSSPIMIEPDKQNQTIKHEEEMERVNSRCESLERSIRTLKRKNAQREIRNMKNMKNMRKQLDDLEKERHRRLNLQASAEERAMQLEVELCELKQIMKLNQGVFRRQQQPETFVEANTGDDTIWEQNESDAEQSGKKGVDYCRELVILRNQVSRKLDSTLPLLVAVSEEEESENSED